MEASICSLSLSLCFHGLANFLITLSLTSVLVIVLNARSGIIMMRVAVFCFPSGLGWPKAENSKGHVTHRCSLFSPLAFFSEKTAKTRCS